MNRKCHICNYETGKYSCPKCDILYCSVKCYQSECHLQCSEVFYKKCVEEELKGSEVDNKDKKKMMEILLRTQENNSEESLDSDDSAEELDFATRLSNVNLDDNETVWGKLTTDERREFRKLVASGNIIKMIPDWEPWWKMKKRKLLVQEVNDDHIDEIIYPCIPSDIPKLCSISKSKPSPTVAYMVLNVLAAYIFTMRWFKGACKEMPVESISTCITLSSTLRSNIVHNTPIEAFASFEIDLYKCKWLQDHNLSLTLINEDLCDMIQLCSTDSTFFCAKAAFADIKYLALQALKILKNDKLHHIKRFSGNPPSINQLQLISKRMTYFLSWVSEYGTALVNSLKEFS